MNTVIAIIVSLVAALLFAVGFVMQQREAAEVPDEDALGIGLITRLIRRPVWLIGTAADGLGYVAQAIALAFGSLVLVQPLLATSLLFALPLGAWWAKRRLHRSDGIWAIALTGGLGVFLVAGNPTEGVDSAGIGVWLIAAAVIVPLVGAFILIASRQPKGGLRAVLLGSSTGILYGAAAALTKSVMSYLDDGFVDVISSWELYALIVVITLGTYLQQSAFQAGSLAQSLPAISVVEPVAAVILGMTVLEEALQADGLEWIAVAAVVMIAATAALARSQGESAPQLEPEPVPAPA